MAIFSISTQIQTHGARKTTLITPYALRTGNMTSVLISFAHISIIADPTSMFIKIICILLYLLMNLYFTIRMRKVPFKIVNGDVTF